MHVCLFSLSFTINNVNEARDEQTRTIVKWNNECNMDIVDKRIEKYRFLVKYNYVP